MSGEELGSRYKREGIQVKMILMGGIKLEGGNEKIQKFG